MISVKNIIRELVECIDNKCKDRIEILENQLSDKFDEASKNDDFYHLPLQNIFHIMKNATLVPENSSTSYFELITTIINKINMTHQNEDQTIFILQNLNIDFDQMNFDQYLSILNSFSKWSFFINMYQCYNNQNKEVEIDYEYELDVKSKEINELKTKLWKYEKNSPIPHKIPIFSAIIAGDIKKFKEIIYAHHLSYKAYDGNGKSTMHYAAEYGRLDIIKYLIQACNFKEFNILDNGENTPLDLACKYGFIECVQFLCHHGAKVNRVDFAERVPELISNKIRLILRDMFPGFRNSDTPHYIDDYSSSSEEIW